MTTHQKALLVVIGYELIAVQGAIVSFNDSEGVPWSLQSLLIALVLIPVFVYLLSRLAQVIFRIQIVMLPQQEFIPRCRICESTHRFYYVTREVAAITEHWNTMHERSVKVSELGALTCDKGHFIEFMKTTETRKSRSYKQSLKTLAAKMRTLREGFHAMYASDIPESDTQS